MKQNIWSIAIVALLASANGFAQNEFNGANIFVAGAQPGLENWQPGTAPEQQLLNQGSGLYSRGIALKGQSTNAGAKNEYKAAHQGWGYSLPGNNAWFRATSTGTLVTFYLDTQTKADGYVPDPDPAGQRGFVYTVPSITQSTDTVRVAGSFVGQLPGGANWDPANNAGTMNDTGANGDTAPGDGIYTLAFTNITPGGYEFKVVLNGDWDLAATVEGWASGGGNIGFNVLATTDNIKILFDSVKGRSKVLNDNPLANPGPPFFAISPSWSLVKDASTQLNDTGANGDVTSGDGIHSRVFTVATATGTADAPTTVQVVQYVGPAAPDSNGFPFITTASNQNVLVQFDTNDRSADGFLPSTKYVWVDPAARRVPTYVQATGSWITSINALFTDWTNNDNSWELLDGGTNGDVAAGDGIFSNTFANPNGIANKDFKAVGKFNSWDFQLGGAGEGYTFKGDNQPPLNFSVPAATPVVFKVDSVTGRIGVGAASNPVRPSTINQAAGSAVDEWSMY